MPRTRAWSAGLAVLLAALVGCGNDHDTDQPIDPGSDSVAEGALLFRESCGMCHGDDGAGSPDGPQVLSPVRGYATHVVRNGRAIEMGYPQAMDPIPAGDLSDVQLTSILDFLSVAPKPTTGDGLYVRFCGNCHGGDATGGRVGEAVAREEVDEIDEKVREGHGGTAYSTREKYMPAWSASELTSAEVELIAAYLGTLPPGPDDEEQDDEDDDD